MSEQHRVCAERMRLGDNGSDAAAEIFMPCTVHNALLPIKYRAIISDIRRKVKNTKKAADKRQLKYHL